MFLSNETTASDSIPLFEIAARVMGKKPETETNPFLAQLEIQTRKKRTKTETGEVFDANGVAANLQGQEISEVRFVDKCQFVKVMNRAFHAAFGLNQAGQKLFWVMMSEIGRGPGQDRVFLHYKCSVVIDGQTVSIPKSTFYRGLEALEGAGFIRQCQNAKGFYWINPNMVWNGDRITLATTYIIANRGKAEASEMPRIQRPGVGVLDPKKVTKKDR
jgi:hypothetical protein